MVGTGNFSGILTASGLGYNEAGKFSINAYNGVTPNYHNILLNETGGGGSVLVLHPLLQVLHWILMEQVHFQEQ